MTNRKTALTLATLGMFTLAAMAVPGSQSAAQGLSAATIELSAQQDKDKDKKTKAAPKTAPRRAEPKRAAPKTAPRHIEQRRVEPRRIAPKQAAPVKTTPNVVRERRVAPVQGSGPSQSKGAGSAVSKAAKTFTPSGPRAGTVTASRFRGLPARGVGRASIRGHNYSVWRSGYRVRRGGGWRTFVALGALTAIMVGGSQFYPYAYISAPEDYCDGLTEDGCQLAWQEVETIEGDIIPQCVAYCPWQ